VGSLPASAERPSSRPLGACIMATSPSQWFDALTVVAQREAYSWLAAIPSSVAKIANFGCWSGSEPFALLWTLNAKELVVVEIEQRFLDDFNQQQELVAKLHPHSLRGRLVSSLCRDMTRPIPELADSHFDLAFCQDVLYSVAIQGGQSALERGIQQMVRVVSPGGLVIAVEPKFGVEFQTRTVEGSSIPISLPIPITEPQDMTPLFSGRNLNEVRIPGSPPCTYSFRKGC
jgi:SAM-dependent methyltransferase